MAIAFDAASNSLAFVNGSYSLSHTPVGVPAAVCVSIIHAGNTATVSAVTYGGVALTLLSISPYVGTSSEIATIHTYFLGSAVPSGAQSASITSVGALGRYTHVMTLTAGADVEVNQATQLLDVSAQANPSASLALNAVSSFVYQVYMSGSSGVGNPSPLTNWSDRGEGDLGSLVSGIYTYNIEDSADVSCGFNNTASDNVLLAGIALNEIMVVGLAITTVGSGTVRRGDTGVIVTGVDFEAVTGTLTISPTDNEGDPNAVVLTTSVWADTSITVDFPSNLSQLYGTVFMFITTNSAVTMANGKSFQYLPPLGSDYLTIKEQSDLGILKDVVGIELDADQIEWVALSQSGGTVKMGVSGTVFINDYAPTQSDQINVRLGDATGHVWNDATITIGSTSLTALTANSLTSLSTIDLPVLTQNQPITPSGEAQLVLISGPTLTSNSPLIVGQLAQSESLSQPSLSENQSIVSSNASQSELLSLPSIVSHGQLSSGNINQSDSIEQPSFAEGQSIVSAGLVSSSTIDPSEFTQHQSLVINNLSQAESLGVPSINQGGTLASSGMRSLSTANASEFVSHGSLILSGLSSDNSLGNVSFSGSSSISINDLSSLTVAGSSSFTQDSLIDIGSVTQSGSLSGNSFTSDNSLLVSGMTSQDSLDTSQFSVDGVLSLSSLASQVFLDSPQVDQHSILAVSGLSALELISSTVVNVSFSLSLSNVANAVSIGQSSLNQVNNLTVENLSSSDLIDQTQVLSIGLIGAAKLTDPMTIGSPSVDAIANSLAVQNLGSLSSIDSSLFIQDNQLNVLDSSSSQLANVVRFGGVIVGIFSGKISVTGYFNAKIVVNK